MWELIETMTDGQKVAIGLMAASCILVLAACIYFEWRDKK
jgi:hypothetical protein